MCIRDRLDDLNRHVRFFGGGLFKGLTDYSFELDDDGVPYWVITSYKNRWLFNLPEADGVLTVNATTGAVSYTHLDVYKRQTEDNGIPLS